jgi:hypothetical protein
VEKPGEWSVYQVKFSIYPDSQGYTSYVYTVLNDATGTPAPLSASEKAAQADLTAEANKAAAQAASDEKAATEAPKAK